MKSWRNADKPPMATRTKVKTSLKDWPKVYKKLEDAGGLTEIERIQFARSVAAMPDERWQMNVNCIRSLGFSAPVRSRRDLEWRKKELRRLEGSSLWQLQMSDGELARGRMFGANLRIVKRCNS
jgi:hypothetical protein